MEKVICVTPRSTTTNNNVFEISYVLYENLDKETCCYYKRLYDGEKVWLLLKMYLEPNWIEVGFGHFVVCMEFNWLKKFLGRVIDNENEWYEMIGS